MLIIEAIAAALVAERVQKALLFPEMQGRDAHVYLPGCLSHAEALGRAGTLHRSRLRAQGMQCREGLLNLLPFAGKFGVA